MNELSFPKKWWIKWDICERSNCFWGVQSLIEIKVSMRLYSTYLLYLYSNLLTPGFHCIAPITRNSAPSRSFTTSQERSNDLELKEAGSKAIDDPNRARFWVAGAILCNEQRNFCISLVKFSSASSTNFSYCYQDTYLLKRWGLLSSKLVTMMICGRPAVKAFVVTQQA